MHSGLHKIISLLNLILNETWQSKKIIKILIKSNSDAKSVTVINIIIIIIFICN